MEPEQVEVAREDPPEPGYWCAECHGQGGWDEDYDDFGAPDDVECWCCRGEGFHRDLPCPGTGP